MILFFAHSQRHSIIGVHFLLSPKYVCDTHTHTHIFSRCEYVLKDEEKEEEEDVCTSNCIPLFERKCTVELMVTSMLYIALALALYTVRTLCKNDFGILERRQKNVNDYLAFE